MASRAALIEEAEVGSSCTVSMPASDRSVTDARDREAARTWRPNEIHQYATALQQLCVKRIRGRYDEPLW